MKSILMAIKPKWCEKICHEIGKDENGKPIYEKRIEVRKSAPKEVPFKAFIYETYDKKYADIGICWANGKCFEHGCKKVIGEFICDKIYKIIPSQYTYYNNVGLPIARKTEYDIGNDVWSLMCLTEKEIDEYSSKGKTLGGLHITDLKSYDCPKELSEFKKAGFMTEEDWLFNLYPNTHCHYAAWAKKFEITHPPQSWMFVEEL